MASFTDSFYRSIPDGATHVLIEERPHRGTIVWATIAIVPGGASVPLNGWSDETLALEAKEAAEAYIATR